MTMENICLYNKFGHCKFGETCQKHHLKELCEIKSCETQSCSKRHPRICKYYYEYRRCKFGSYCSFSHRASSSNTIENYDKISELERKMSSLEKTVTKSEIKIKKLEDAIDSVEVKNKKLEADLELALQTVAAVSEIVAKKVTEAVVGIISNHQEDVENRNEATFEAINSKLEELSSLLMPSGRQPHHRLHLLPPSASQQPSASLPTSATQPTIAAQTRAPSNQCDVCGKSFGSQRALTNHMRTDHKPN